MGFERLGVFMFGVRVSQIIDVLRFLLSVEPSDVAKVIDTARLLQGDADTKVKIRACLDVAAVITRYTPSQTDDELVAHLIKLADNESLWVLVDLVEDILAGRDHQESESVASSIGDVPSESVLAISAAIADVIDGLQKGGKK